LETVITALYFENEIKLLDYFNFKLLKLFVVSLTLFKFLGCWVYKYVWVPSFFELVFEMKSEPIRETKLKNASVKAH